MSLVHDVVHYIHNFYIVHFLLVWLCLLILIIVGGLHFSDQGNRMFQGFSPDGNEKSRRRFTLSDGISAGIFLLFLGGYVALILYKEDFAYYDDDMLTDFSVRGRPLPPPIWPSIGRFFPLSDQSFNLLRFITRSPAGYHSFVIIQLMLLLLVLYAVVSQFTTRYRALILSAAMLAPSMLIPFSGFVYPERSVLLWLTVMLLCIYGHTKTGARVYFVGCLVATHFALYYKETVIVLIGTIAATRIVLDWRAHRSEKERSWRELAHRNSLSFGMVAVCALYVVLFVAAMLPREKFSYVASHHESLGHVIRMYLETDWIPFILLAVVAVRVIRYLFYKGELDRVWFPVAMGAVAYFVAIIGLRIYSGYYLAPVDFLGLLYLARLTLEGLHKPGKLRAGIAVAAFACVVVHSAAYSAFRVVERKTVIERKRELAGFLRDYLPTQRSETVTLYFPYANGYRLMELSSYLRYKGFKLVGMDETSPQVGPRIAIEGREQFQQDHCVPYNEYRCVYRAEAPEGALTVILPDDDVQICEVENMGKGATPLFAVEASPFSTRIGGALKLLHAISPMHPDHELPDHWLRLDVFKRPEQYTRK